MKSKRIESDPHNLCLRPLLKLIRTKPSTKLNNETLKSEQSSRNSISAGKDKLMFLKKTGLSHEPGGNRKKS